MYTVSNGNPLTRAQAVAKLCAQHYVSKLPLVPIVPAAFNILAQHQFLKCSRSFDESCGNGGETAKSGVLLQGYVLWTLDGKTLARAFLTVTIQ